MLCPKPYFRKRGWTMFWKKMTLFKLFGFEIRIDLSWLIIAVFITWARASGVFPYYIKGLPPKIYWLMALGGAFGFFSSIVIHEFAHSLIARRAGLPIHGITLFIFGGVAEMGDEPRSAKTEFFMAIAGPLASIVLGMGLFA